MTRNSPSLWYPPSRYLFMPLYRRLRRRFGQPAALYLLAAISGLLHGAAFGLTRPNGLAKGVALGVVFGGLAAAGYGFALRSKRRARAGRRAIPNP